MGDLARNQNPPYPLDEILGTRATVRTLRVLCGPTSYFRSWPIEMALESGLTRQGVWKSLNRLKGADLIIAGTSSLPRSVPWRINRHHRLVPPLIDLFAAEQVALRLGTSLFDP